LDDTGAAAAASVEETAVDPSPTTRTPGSGARAASEETEEGATAEDAAAVEASASRVPRHVPLRVLVRILLHVPRHSDLRAHRRIPQRVRKRVNECAPPLRPPPPSRKIHPWSHPRLLGCRPPRAPVPGPKPSHQDAEAGWHLRGRPVRARPGRRRLMHLAGGSRCLPRAPRSRGGTPGVTSEVHQASRPGRARTGRTRK